MKKSKIERELEFCEHMKEFIKTVDADKQHTNNELQMIKEDIWVMRQYKHYRKIYCVQEAFRSALRDCGYEPHKFESRREE